MTHLAPVALLSISFSCAVFSSPKPREVSAGDVVWSGAEDVPPGNIIIADNLGLRQSGPCRLVKDGEYSVKRRCPWVVVERTPMDQAKTQSELHPTEAEQVSTHQIDGRRVALLIGNGDYHGAPLKNAVADAELMATTLRELDFDTQLLRDATRDEMVAALEQFGETRRGAQISLFFFAGHGVQVRGRNYLVPLDAELREADELAARTIGVDEIVESMTSTAGSVNFVILDACRDNPFPSLTRSTSRGLAYVEAPRGVLIGYATSPGSVALDGAGEHGLYTAALVEALSEPGLQAETVFKRTRERVSQTAHAAGATQIPFESSSLTNDFVFNLAPVAVQGP